MKKIINNEKYIKKGRMRDAYSTLDLCKKNEVLATFEYLLLENEHPNPEIRQSILPCIAIYKTLLKYNYSKIQARDIVRKSALDSYSTVAKFAHTMSKLPFFFSVFRVLCRMSMKEGLNEKGWSFKWRENDKYAMEWECYSCIYANIFVKYGVKELAPIFCECEDSIYGNLKYARFDRTKTIGRGSDLCNFSFYNKKKEGKSNE